MTENNTLIDNPEFPHLYLSAKTIETADCLKALHLTVNPERHVYLRHHTYLGKGIVPATVLMEIFSEAALWFAGDLKNKPLHLSCINNLSIERPVLSELDGTSEALILLLDQSHEEGVCRAKLRITSPRINNKGKIVGTRLNAEAEVVLTEEEPKTEPVVLPEIKDYIFYDIPLTSLYFEEGAAFLFLGDTFKSRTGKMALAPVEDISLSEYDCQNKDKLLIKGIEEGYILSPVGFDATIQGGVALYLYKSKVGTLPVGAKSVKVYQRQPGAGKCKLIASHITFENDVFYCDITSYDQEGKKITFMERAGFRLVPEEDKGVNLLQSYVQKNERYRKESIDW